MLYKFCKCGKKIEYSLKMCKECADKEDSRIKERYKDYRRRRADKDIQTFYASKEWKIARDKAKIRDNYVCKLCWDKKVFKFAEVVHHICEVKEDFNKRLELDNLICLCNCCHKEVHDEYKKNKDSKNKMQEKLKSLIK